MLVVYRTCSQEFDTEIKSIRPSWFSKENCLNNALQTFDNKDVKFVIFYDGHTNTKWFDLLRKTNKDISVICEQDNKRGLIKCYEFINLHIHNHDSVYLLEDDFYHLPKSFEVLKESLKITGLSTLYHHPDRFHRDDDLFAGHEEIFAGYLDYYRTMESTTGTFALTQEKFLDVYDQLLYHNVNDRLFFRDVWQTKGLRLICPINTYSTHIYTLFLSKFVDWENLKRTS